MRKSMKNKVLWYDSTGTEHVIDVKRTPKLGWHSMTLIEKLLDSAKTSLHIQIKKETPDYTTIFRSLNKALTIVRNDIELAKKRSNQTFLKACEFRETKRTRCKGYPTKYDCVSGLYLCEKHHSNYDSKDFSEKKFYPVFLEVSE